MSDSNSNKAVCATTLGVGILIGAGIALLCAPRTGKETRELIGKKAGELKKTLGSWTSCDGEQCDQNQENAEGSDKEQSAQGKDAQAKDSQNNKDQNKDQNKSATAQAPQGQNTQNNSQNNQNKPNALQGAGRA